MNVSPFLVDGPGFNFFDETTSFAIESSLTSYEIETDWESPKNVSFPIRFTLKHDIYSSTPRFIQITVASDTIVSGLYLETFK